MQYEVEDSGIGIKEDDKEKLFKSFERLSADDYSGEQGMGLGLTIVNKFVETLNGNIRVNSEIGKGSSFIIELNLQKNSNEGS